MPENPIPRNLNRLRTLRAVLGERIDSLQATDVSVLYQENGLWIRVGDGARVRSAWLTRALTWLAGQHEPHQWGDDVLIPLSSGVAPAIVAVRGAIPALGLTTIRQVVDHLVDIADERVGSAFDPLTSLPARRSLEHHLAGLARSETAKKDARHIAVILFDLDHFKQANDSLGHDFGDALLVVAGMRLRSWTSELERRARARSILGGRWGGEEFFIFGRFRPETVEFDLEQLVKQWREPNPIISPSEKIRLRQVEPGRYTEQLLAGKLAKRPTISVGWTWLRTPSGDDWDEVAATARAEADRAMYRAKQTGRDRVVAFDTIRQNGGRVLKHRTEAGIVVIDIGSGVGVQPGDVFEIHPPDFAEAAEFRYTDGRTEKVLGTFPRVRAAAEVRVCAEPGPDLAFCVVESIRPGVTEIAPRSHLRMIKPAGSSASSEEISNV